MHRRPLFGSASLVRRLLLQLRHAAAAERFAILAYCFMPNHLHALVEGLQEDSGLRRFVNIFKQRSGFEYGRATRQLLWQPGYDDHVLRNEEAAVNVAAYIIHNPVRAGLVDNPRRFRFLGSDAYRLEDLLDSLPLRPGP